jgi:superfamily II DNA helicase RecQ
LIIKGSIRTPESVRYKINFFIDSYKEAKERMENTGAGLEGASFEKFQDYVVAKVCKYYLELDPILKNRPNVFPMYTNQHKEEKDKAVAPECIVLEDDPIETRFSNTEFNDTDAFTSSSTSENVLNNNYNSSSDSSTKMSPYKASLVRKSMLRENKKQIHGKTKKLKNTSVTSSDSEERDYMMDCRKKRLELEEKRDLRMGMIEEKKINLEMQRMIMDQTSTELKFESIRLHNMQEKKKLMLINMEVYEKRLKMKRDNPELSEDVLDEMFPMDE